MAQPSSSNSSDHQEEPALRLGVVGGGAAGLVAAAWASRHGADVTLFNDGQSLGGACVNVGCFPARILLHVAQALYTSNHHRYAGLESSARIVDFGAVIAQKRALVAALKDEHVDDVVKSLANVTHIQERARLLDKQTVLAGDSRYEFDRIILAMGSSPHVPHVEGLDDVEYDTGETLLDLEECPESLLIIGASPIGLECAQMFSRFGCRVTVIEGEERILPSQMTDLCSTLAEFLEEEGVELVTSARVERIRRGRDGRVEATVEVLGETHTFSASHIAFTAERRPNTRHMGLEDIGIVLDSNGFIKVGETMETSVAGIYAAGDVTGHSGSSDLHAYTADHDGKLAAHNAVMASKTAGPYTAVPFVVNTDPAVAGVGWDEAQARAHGFDADARVVHLSELVGPRAACETRGFIKLIRDRRSNHVLGARILATNGPEFLMEVAFAIRNGLTVQDIAAALHPIMTYCDGLRLAAARFGPQDGATSTFTG